MRNQGAMLGDASVREGYVQGAMARGFEAAGSNSAGSAQAFMGMGMGMGAGGSFMASASQTNAAQMARDEEKKAAAEKANGWRCACAADSTGNFCQNCGSKKPAPAGGWKCTCGADCTGNFCQNCGAKKPASDADWFCSECGTKNSAGSKFCQNCGNRKG